MRHLLTEEAIAAVLQAQAIDVPPLPRLLADDLTPRRGRRCWSSKADAGSGLDRGRDHRHHRRPLLGEHPFLGVWLKAHSGDALRVDRKSRDPQYVENPALTLSLMAQPAVPARLSSHQAFKGRGLLVRFLYALPESNLGNRTIAPPPVPSDVEHGYGRSSGA